MALTLPVTTVVMPPTTRASWRFFADAFRRRFPYAIALTDRPDG
jgi:hypothetical protein